MCKVQYKQHQYNNGCNIQVQILKCVKHQCQIEEKEDNWDIFGIEITILIPVKEWVNK